MNLFFAITLCFTNVHLCDSILYAGEYMKKINKFSLNKNKFKTGFKMILISTAIGLVALINSGCKNNNAYEEPTTSTSQTDIDNDNFTTDKTQEEVVQEKETMIDIKDDTFSNSGVSICNTDFKISDELTNQINNHINNFGGDCSFIAINLNDGMSFGYNVDKSYQTASTIKVAFSLYSFKEIDKGNGSLDELKLYEERFRRDGSGVLKDKSSGANYSLKDLFYYTINYSDNTAYYMVHDRFYSDEYNNFLSELGCKQLYLRNGAKWGFIDARSMALVWQEIYKYKDQSENGKYLFELLTNAEYNYINEGMEKYESAHKSGWTKRETHDSGIVFANDDYIVVVLNNNNGNYSAKSQLLKLSSCIEKVIDEYTLYKEDSKSKQKTLTK